MTQVEPAAKAPEQEEQPAAPEGGRRGLPGVLGWTLLGALVPGSGLMAAGWRKLGAAVLAVLVVGGAVLVALALAGNPLEQGISLAVDPGRLLVVAVAAAVIGALWITVIALTSFTLQREAPLSLTQRGFASLLALVLIAAIGLPAAQASHYALIQRGVVTSKDIFEGDPDNRSTGPDAAQADPWANKPRVNVLLIGSDAGADRTGIRPDTLILASIDTRTGDTVLFSLPRSLQRAPFPKGTPGREAWPKGFDCGDQCLLNAIWTWGEDNPGYQKFKHPGLVATEDAVEGVTGLKVDTYVMLNLRGFTQFVNAVGGVTVDVRERLPIGGDSNPASPIYHVATGGWIEIGDNQHLDGYHALWFARSRWSTDDYDRMQRQRCVIGAVVQQADPVTLALAYPKIARTLRSNLSTGIAASDLQAWVELSQKVQDGKSVRSLPFTSKVINTVRPDFHRLRVLVTRALRPPSQVSATPTPGTTAMTSPGADRPTVTPTPRIRPPRTPTLTRAQDITKVC